MKTCVICKQEKPIEMFSKSKNCKDGVETRCRPCNNLRRLKLYKRKKYGLNEIDYQAFKDKHNNVCCICGKVNASGRELAIDEDHNNGNKLRGLLCSPCNIGLGMFHDDLELLANAIKYLAKYNSPTSSRKQSVIA